MADEFDRWAIVTNWTSKPWYVRMCLSLLGRKPNLCEHEYITRNFREFEHGHRGYYRHNAYTEKFCPKCGDVAGKQFLSKGAWKSDVG